MKCDFCKVWIPIILLVGIGFYVASLFVEPPPPTELRIATGREGGAYYAFAQEYKQHLEEQGVTLDIQQTAGSVEALEYLLADKVSAAFVQGGTAASFKEASDKLSAVASLFYEPLWLFYRVEQPTNYLSDLRGKKIAVGEEGSGGHVLALQLLKDNQVTKENTSFMEISNQKAVEQLIAGEIDAAFFVISPTAELIPILLNDPNIKLMSFKRALAYSGRYKFLTRVIIGEGMLDLENNLPREDKILLAATANLVVRNDIHPDLIRLLLKQAIKVHKNGGLLEEQGIFPSANLTELPINKNAAQYLKSGPPWLENIFPFWLASMIDRLKIMLIPLLTLMLPLFKGAMPVYRWRIRSKIYRWYGLVRDIDRQADELSESKTVEPRKRLEMIEEEIKRFKMVQKELNDQVSVPLSYMGEFYTLRLHLLLISNRLKESRAEIIAFLKAQEAKS